MSEAIPTRRRPLANHLTPAELADEVDMKRQEVIARCVQMGVPILHGRIDKTLFAASLRRLTQPSRQQAV
jgi:hypothetical protein